MSLPLRSAAIRAYDMLKTRPGAPVRRSDARDSAALDAVAARLGELIATYRVGGHEGVNGRTYVFWHEVSGAVQNGLFDDLIDRL